MKTPIKNGRIVTAVDDCHGEAQVAELFAALDARFTLVLEK
jgi:hypothetical protein